jgi:transcriptional regulator with XRE-family HTH domain
MGTTGRRPVYRHFAKVLARNLRARRGESSLRDFAPQMGLSKSELQRIEAGEQNPSLSTLELICRKLKCTIGELFDEKGGSPNRE